MNNPVDHGTSQRQRKSHLNLEARDVAKGGTVINTGLRDPNPTKLDWLKNQEYLGNDMESQRRYQAGMRLWSIYTAFGDTHGAPVIEAMQGSGAYQRFVQEHDIGRGNDIAETLFKSVLRLMRDQASMVWSVCIDGALQWPQNVCTHPQYIVQVCRALDLLESTMQSEERRLSDDLEKLLAVD